MAPRRRRVAILGGGMAGITAAWRLSEPGWRDEFESITVYQRGWRLGGKGASGRGANGRIEEHGLHIWLGYYENAFRILREAYAELDRPNRDPEAPIRTWRDAMVPATRVGLEERHDHSWSHWMGDFAPNDELPGEPDTAGGPMTVVNFLQRSLRLLADFAGSLAPAPSSPVVLSASPRPPRPTDTIGPVIAVAAGAAAALLDGWAALTSSPPASGTPMLASVDDALADLRAAIDRTTRGDEPTRRAAHLFSVVLATARGIIADGLLTDERGFATIDDEDYRAWVSRHGAAPEAVESTLIGGLYDLVFAHVDGDPERTSFGAGWGVFLSGKTFFDFKGAIFWKMTAGMGDVVFAPLYEALLRRGVTFEFFRRVDALHVSDDRTRIGSISLGAQVALAAGRDRYDPLVRVKQLPCFPVAPLAKQIVLPEGVDGTAFERLGAEEHDVAHRVLVAGEDFDVAVLAIPVGMAPIVCRELIEARDAWRDMVANVRTVATQAFQLWLTEDEPSLGWPWPASTTTSYVRPFETWASMPQVIDAEDWPADEGPGTIAYFCSTLAAPLPDDGDWPGYHRRQQQRVQGHVRRFVEEQLAGLLPGVSRNARFRWELLCGSDVASPEALSTQFITANVDPSDRYVQSVAGSDRFRLRPDESGFDNLFLAGDWTDCGLNAGCIEAAAISGLQAANAVLGRSRWHRIGGFYRA